MSNTIFRGLRRELRKLENEIHEWKEEEKEKLFNEMIQTINQKEKMIDHLQRTNTELVNYAINLEKVCGLQ